jgi:NAD(P)-dependent dehydrogenase (short-subunit alcohol dehydrogenase family)
VTGGARGLGNAIAVSFAREGARGVVIVDINQATLEEGKKIVESYGTKCLAVQADVTKEEDVERAVAAAVEEFGRIDYAAYVAFVFLVVWSEKGDGELMRVRNFAGVLGPATHTFETSFEDYQKCMAVNCTGVFLSTKHEIRQMMKQESIEV